MSRKFFKITRFMKLIPMFQSRKAIERVLDTQHLLDNSWLRGRKSGRILRLIMETRSCTIKRWTYVKVPEAVL